MSKSNLAISNEAESFKKSQKFLCYSLNKSSKSRSKFYLSMQKEGGEKFVWEVKIKRIKDTHTYTDIDCEIYGK